MKSILNFCILIFILSCTKDENPQPIQTQGYNMLLIGNSFFKPYADHLSSLATEANLNEHISAVVKDGAAKGSPLKSQESRFLIPNKTHRKAALPVTVAPEQVTAAQQGAGPRVIRTALRGTPKDCIVTLIGERTIAVTVTRREGVKAAAVV